MLKRYKNLKIAYKMMIGFFVVALLAGVIGAVGIIGMISIGDNDRILYEKRTLGLHYTSEAALSYQKIRCDLTAGLLAAGTTDQAVYLEKIDNYIGQTDEALINAATCLVDQQDRQIHDTVLKNWNTYKTMAQNVVGLMKDLQSDAARNMMLGDMKTIAKDLQSAFDLLNEDMTQDARQSAETNAQVVNVSIIIILSVALACMAISVLLGFAISRIISKPIYMVTRDAEKLALGDVDIESASVAPSDDEVGDLITSFKRLAAERKLQVVETQRLAGGDLTADITKKSEKDILNQSLIALVEQLNIMIVTIKNSARQVASGSSMLSHTSVALSQGAAEQASAIQQLTATLEEMTSQTSLMAENAQLANQLTKNAEANADTGNIHMKRMQTAMDDINEASIKIKKVIKTIDSIAFQTNILALNAAVEAAQAGMYGKGFAVVANEVRMLATQSALAVKETTELIETSIKKVNNGMTIADEMAMELGQIASNVSKAASLVEEISSASCTQAVALEQINQGVVMIASVAQGNAAKAEESAAASEELSSQSDMLNDLISTFIIKNTQHVSSPMIIEAIPEYSERGQSSGANGLLKSIVLSNDKRLLPSGG